MIYLWPRVTLNFDLLTHKVDRFMHLPFTTCVNLHQNWFTTCFQNIIKFWTDER